MPIARAMACDAVDHADLRMNQLVIDKCMMDEFDYILTPGALHDCLADNKVSRSCSVCAASALDAVQMAVASCENDYTDTIKRLNGLRDDYDISSDSPVICGITKEFMSDYMLDLFKNDRINECFAKYNVSTELATPPPLLPLKKDNVANEPKAAVTGLPLENGRADDNSASGPTTSPKSSFTRIPRKWTAILVLSVVLLSHI